MSAFAWNNFLTYSLQVALLVGAAGWIPAAARLRSPKARLVFFQALLAACLLLPVVRPWKSEALVVTAPEASKGAWEVVTPQAASSGSPFDARKAALALLAVGALARLGMLALGMLRLRRYRLRSEPLVPATAWSVEADLRVSGDITGPVTFGFVRPVILLPVTFPGLPDEMRDAILCHETLHVRRRDWLFTAFEEFIRAGLWFHPAIWWLLGEIQLAREQAVDREAVGMTNARDPYVDALLAAAGAPFQADLAPAPLFLRKRHLKQRVVSILKEKRMSKTRTVSTLAASLAILAGACWFVTGILPLFAQPQLAPDSPGVTVDTQGATLMHRAPVFYPREALANSVEGMVVAQVKLDQAGNVTDASILSGPDELRKPVLQSLLSWHFTKDAGGSSRQIAVTFRVPAPVQAPAAVTAQSAMMPPPPPPSPSAGLLAARRAELTRAGEPTAAGPPTVLSIQVEGMGIPSEEVLNRLPVHVNDPWTPDLMLKIGEAAREIDEHLNVSSIRTAAGVVVRISPPPPPPLPATPRAVPAGAITVGGRVQAQKLISNPQPIYPTIARQARISGTVELAAIIALDGHVQELSVVSGHPLLRQAALDAVKQWVYSPTLLNGQPVIVSTTIDIVFSLNN